MCLRRPGCLSESAAVRQGKSQRLLAPQGHGVGAEGPASAHARSFVHSLIQPLSSQPAPSFGGHSEIAASVPGHMSEGAWLGSARCEEFAVGGIHSTAGLGRPWEQGSEGGGGYWKSQLRIRPSMVAIGTSLNYIHVTSVTAYSSCPAVPQPTVQHHEVVHLYNFNNHCFVSVLSPYTAFQ